MPSVSRQDSGNLDDEPLNGVMSSEDEQLPPSYDSDDSQEEVEELRAEDFEASYNERDGRLFHTRPNCPYPLPVDANELARLRLMNEMLHRLLGVPYHCPMPEVLAPTPEGRKRKVLDLCTGTGNWVMDMAALFPRVVFRGVDIVPIATRYPLDNVRFEMHDVSEPMRWSDGDFDLIHARDISMAVKDWPNLINECARLLRPGGLFVSCEWAHYPVFDSSYNLDVNTQAPAAVKFFSAIRRILHSNGVQLDTINNLPRYLSDSERFTDVKQEQRDAPIGPWAGETLSDIGNDQKSILQRFANSVMPVFTASGMTEMEAGQIIADYLQELDNVEGLVCRYAVTYALKVY